MSNIRPAQTITVSIVAPDEDTPIGQLRVTTEHHEETFAQNVRDAWLLRKNALAAFENALDTLLRHRI